MAPAAAAAAVSGASVGVEQRRAELGREQARVPSKKFWLHGGPRVPAGPRRVAAEPAVRSVLARSWARPTSLSKQQTPTLPVPVPSVSKPRLTALSLQMWGGILNQRQKVGNFPYRRLFFFSFLLFFSFFFFLIPSPPLQPSKQPPQASAALGPRTLGGDPDTPLRTSPAQRVSVGRIHHG